MSEKITFRELIESIAEETDHSKQFTHDFLKDFVDVINSGLEQDGNVNIAGFGKFKLRRVDERQGYNPQTEEKITIPAHNKIVFKPYKDVRELVNAPYAHLEPTLIEQPEERQANVEEDQETAPSDDEIQDSREDDFIPTGPPTSLETDKETASSEEEPPENMDETEDDPFGFDKQETSSSTSFSLDEDTESPEAESDSDDVVEFQRESDTTHPGDEIDEDLSKFIGQTPDKSTEEESKQTVQKSADEHPFEDNPSSDFSAAGLSNEDSKNRSSLPGVVAAGFILLLVAIGALYFSTIYESETPDLATEEMVSSSEISSLSNAEDESGQEPSAQNEADNTPVQQADQPSQQGTTTSETEKKSSQEEQHAIEKGQTLWSLAEEKYGNPRLWPWIYGNNSSSLNNPDLIYAGSSLSVPLPSGAENSLNSADSVGVSKGYLATYRWYKDNQSPKAKNHLWAAKNYHENIHDIADVRIDTADLSYAERSR